MDESCPEGPEYSTIVTFRCPCYNGRHYFFARAVLILELILFQLLNEEGEGTFQISCYNSGCCFATSQCPIKFDFNCRLKNASGL